jgi:YegS/Rv2252/BmrU family lipid kinase
LELKKAKLLYNPSAGESIVIDKLDEIIRIHQKHGYQLVTVRLDESFRMREALSDINEGYDHIIVAGGDGTVDLLVNEMMREGITLPIGILPAGTANDYSKYIGMPPDLSAACEKILTSVPVPMDIGMINEKYFINVASAGLFTDVSQKTDDDMKNSIGKLAYYLKGLEQIPNFRRIHVKITSKDGSYDGGMFMVLVFNGRTAGNIELAYKAKGNDGKLDVILIKDEALREIFPMLIKFLRGEHLEEPVGLIYFQTDELTIETTDRTLVSDIDGERGPDFPLKIRCIPDAITVMGVNEEDLEARKRTVWPTT